MNAGDSWGENARYGVMCVEGWSDSALTARTAGATYSFCFWVLDSHDMYREVKCFKGVGRELGEFRVQRARQRALEFASDLNRQKQAITQVTGVGAH